MTQVIPTRRDVPAYALRVDLTGVEFLLNFRYNERDSAWYFSIADQAADPIVSGIKIVLGLPLIRNSVDLRRPAGDFIAIDTTGAGLEPTALDDLGDRVLLCYEDGT